MTRFFTEQSTFCYFWIWQKKVWKKAKVSDKVLYLSETCIKQIKKEEKSFSQNIVKTLEVSKLDPFSS